MLKAERVQLIGHSMGGSVLVRTCPMLLAKKYRVTGVAVLDVVEGTIRIIISCIDKDSCRIAH